MIMDLFKNRCPYILLLLLCILSLARKTYPSEKIDLKFFVNFCNVAKLLSLLTQPL